MKKRNKISFLSMLLVLLGVAELAQAHYSPQLGRFLSRDPIEERGGVNVHAFVRNDPINNWDKLGQMPTLTAKEIKYKLGTCGSFGWKVEFTVSPLKEDTGIILQKVNPKIKYQKYNGLGELQATEYTDGPKVNPYHEVWNASENHTRDWGNPADSFHYKMDLKPVSGDYINKGGIPNSKGEATFVGYARYYPNLSFAERQISEFGQIGWKRNNPDTWAHDLWSGAKNPGWLSAGATASKLLKHEIKVKWDCCLEEKETELVSKKIQ